jgi:hypothetical protein
MQTDGKIIEKRKEYAKIIEKVISEISLYYQICRKNLKINGKQITDEKGNICTE